MNNNDFDLEHYVSEMLNTIKQIHDESVANGDRYYKYTHIFHKEEIDAVTEAWDKCKWIEIY